MNAFVSPSEIQLSRFEHGIIHRKVGQLIGRAGFTRNDRHSLIQELTTRLIHSLRHFDPQKAADFDQIVGTLIQQGDLAVTEIPSATKPATGYQITNA